MSGARYFAKLRERQRDAQIKAMRERSTPCECCGGPESTGVWPGARVCSTCIQTMPGPGIEAAIRARRLGK